MKRIVTIVGSLGLVTLLGITMAGGIVDAQTSTPAGTPTESTSKKDQFLTALAGKLGVSTDTLQTAIEQTIDEVGFGPGRFGDRLRERIHDRIQNHQDRVVARRDLSDAAAFIGISEDELKVELQDDRTFIEIAREHGKTDDQIRTYLIDRATSAIDERLQAASDNSSTPTGA